MTFPVDFALSGPKSYFFAKKRTFFEFPSTFDPGPGQIPRSGPDPRIRARSQDPGQIPARSPDPGQIPARSLADPGQIPGRSLADPGQIPGRSLADPCQIPARLFPGSLPDPCQIIAQTLTGQIPDEYLESGPPYICMYKQSSCRRILGESRELSENREKLSRIAVFESLCASEIIFGKIYPLEVLFHVLVSVLLLCIVYLIFRLNSIWEQQQYYRRIHSPSSQRSIGLCSI